MLWRVLLKRPFERHSPGRRLEITRFERNQDSPHTRYPPVFDKSELVGGKIL